MIKQRFFQALAVGFVVLYFGVAFAGWFSLDALSAYAEYGFDALFGGIVFVIYRQWQWKKKNYSLGAAVAFFFALAAGFAVFEASAVLGYSLPFSVRDPETIFFLLLVAPLLEEWIFRGALWRLFEVITGSPWPGFLVTAVAFSYAHYYVIGEIDPKYASFIRYQAIYTLGLGLFCGGVRLQFGWIAALITHAAFNLGFGLANL